MEGDGEQSEEIEYDNDGDPIPRLSSGTERQRGDDDANVPDTLPWTAAAAAPPGEQPTATGFGLDCFHCAVGYVLSRPYYGARIPAGNRLYSSALLSL